MSDQEELTVLLTARDLSSKWGFNDGDTPDHLFDYFYDNDLMDSFDWHEVLQKLVRKHLVPLLPEDLEVYDMLTSHNPIRTDYWGERPDHYDVPDISVSVTIEQILEEI